MSYHNRPTRIILFQFWSFSVYFNTNNERKKAAYTRWTEIQDWQAHYLTRTRRRKHRKVRLSEERTIDVPIPMCKKRYVAVRCVYHTGSERRRQDGWQHAGVTDPRLTTSCVHRCGRAQPVQWDNKRRQGRNWRARVLVTPVLPISVDLYWQSLICSRYT